MSLSRRSGDATRLRSGDEGGETKEWGGEGLVAAPKSRSGDEASETGGGGPGLNEAVVLAELKHRVSNAGSQSGKTFIDALQHPRTSRKSLVASSKASVASSDSYQIGLAMVKSALVSLMSPGLRGPGDVGKLRGASRTRHGIGENIVMSDDVARNWARLGVGGGKCEQL